MKKGFTLPAILIGAILVIGALFTGYNINQERFGAIPIESAFFEDSLGESMTAAQTTMTLYRGTNNEGSAISGTFGFVIDEGGTNQEVVVCACTGTACTSCERGIDSTDGQTEVTANKNAHRRGDSVKMTDHPTLIRLIRIINGTDAVEEQLYYDVSPTSPSSTAILAKSYIDGAYAGLTADNTLSGTLTITGTTTMSTTTFDAVPTIPSTGITADTDVASKKYVDDIAIAGSPTSTELVYGITRLSIAADNINLPIAYGANDLSVKEDYTFTTYTAGEDITKNDAIAITHKDNCIIYATTTHQFTGTESKDTIYDTDWSYQSFITPADSADLYAFYIAVDVVSSAHTVNLKLRATPTGSDLLTCDAASVSHIDTGYAGCTSLTPLELSTSTVYYIIVQSGGHSTDRIYTTTTNAYADGTFATSTDSGATWGVEAYDAVFEILYAKGDANKAFKAGKMKYYNTSADQQIANITDCRTNYIGFADADTTEGDSVNVIHTGVWDNFTGLDMTQIYAEKYFLINSTSTANLGEITTSVDALTTDPVGMQLSSSSMLIININE